MGSVLLQRRIAADNFKNLYAKKTFQPRDSALVALPPGADLAASKFLPLVEGG